MDMNHSETFRPEREGDGIGMTDAIKLARRAVAGLTDLPIDAVAHTERTAEGDWQIVIDVVESPARMGDNDLLAAFDVRLGGTGELLFCSRTHRYRREEA